MADVSVFPSKGLRVPLTGASDLLDGGMTVCNGWTLRGNTLTLQEGYTSLAARQTITGDTTGRVKCIFTYRDQSAELYVGYVIGTKLRVFNYNNGNEVTVVDPIVLSDLDQNISVAYFRKYILLGTIDNGLWWFDPATVTAGKAGVAAPVGAPTGAVGAATGLTGSYSAAYTYVNALGRESNKSPVSNTVAATDDKIDWSGIAVGPAGTVSRRFYRTVANGSLYLFHSTIADNITTTISADALADGSLGAEAPLTNFVPIEGVRHVATNAIRVFLVDSVLAGATGFTVYASAIDPDTGEPNFEAYPTELSVTFPVSGGIDLLQGTIALPNGDLYVASKQNIWRVTGDVGLEPVIDKVADVGWFNSFSGVLTPAGLFFIDNTAKVWLFDGETLQDIGIDIQQAIHTFVNAEEHAPANGDFLSVTYHAMTNQVHINDSLIPSAFVYDLRSRQWNTLRTGFKTTHYSEMGRSIFGTKRGFTEIFVDNLSVYSFDGSQYSAQYVEFYPIYLNGQNVQLNKIKLEVQSLPVVSFVPPTLKVEWALDGDAYYTTSYVDLSPKNIRGAFSYTPPITPHTIARTIATKTVEVPVHKVAKSISIRLSTVNNNSSYTNGMQVYKIWLDVDGLDEPAKDDRSFKLDKEL